jgi:hypothetical protein
MDDRTLQFVLFLGVAAGLYTLVTVGIEIARRFVLQSRASHASTVAMVTDVVSRND